MRPTSRPHIPAQLTTTSHAMSPWSVLTPVAAPRSRRMPVTRTFSRMVAPPLRAPRASARVVSIGFVRPSPGIHTAPARSSVRISGQRCPASLGEITWTSTPKHRAIDAPRLSSISRSAVRATLMLPDRRNPVACPVSASRRS